MSDSSSGAVDGMLLPIRHVLARDAVITPASVTDDPVDAPHIFGFWVGYGLSAGWEFSLASDQGNKYKDKSTQTNKEQVQ